jgi:hypothetical protein
LVKLVIVELHTHLMFISFLDLLTKMTNFGVHQSNGTCLNVGTYWHTQPDTLMEITKIGTMVSQNSTNVLISNKYQMCLKKRILQEYL